MDVGNLELGILFLAQTGVGIFGNFFLFCFYSFSLLTGYKVKPTDLILNQLVLANSLVLLSKGITQTIVAFRWRYFLDDAGCKLIFYFHRVATGVSFRIVCLLNGFQAIKLNPCICRWVELKMGSLKFIGLCCFLCWVLQLLINSFVIVLVTGPLKSKNSTVKETYGYCSWTMTENHVSVHTFLYYSPDIMSLIFMALASGSIVLVLHRHKQQVQHIHSHKHSSRLSHETRAIHTILVLVIYFVTFYLIYIILTLWMTVATNPGRWSVNSSVLVASCFPALSPLVLIANDKRISQFCFTCRVKTIRLLNIPQVG